MNEKKILAIVTNIPEFTKVGYRTGLWLGELTHFMDVVEAAGFTVDIASPSGGWVPIDPESLIIQEAGAMIGLGGDVHARYADRAFMNKLHCTANLRELDCDDYAGIYLAGGHGTMYDFRRMAVPDLVEDFFEADKVVSAVCHGPVGLLDAHTNGGVPKYRLEGRRITGFSWKEEELAKRDEAVPFSLEEALGERGAIYEKGTVPFTSHVVTDGKLITGQNPQSAKGVAEAVVECLSHE